MLQGLAKRTCGIYPRSEDERRGWWLQTASLRKELGKGWQWLVLMDGSIRRASEESKAVQGHQADEQDDVSALAHELLLELRTFVPSTFAQMMKGPGGTLVQKRTGAADRSDSVCLPQSWQPLQIQAQAEPTVTAGHKCIDHMCLMVNVRLIVLSRPPPRKLSAAAIRDLLCCAGS